MEALLYIWLVLAAFMALATGETTIVPSNWTSADVDRQSDNEIGISISNGDKMDPLGPILALTSRGRDDIPPTGLSGPVFILEPSSLLKLSDSNIALISCENPQGNVEVANIFSLAEGKNVTGVIFYSQHADFCDLRGYTGDFPWVYTTKSQGQAEDLLHRTFSTFGAVYATIGPLVRQIKGSSSSSRDSAAANDDNKHDSNMNPLGPSPSTAVAMIILYSITGIITALFLIIIVTGALRAHRHPERYGPRNVTGRPRQSRARGLARAMLETLPIVKFGEQEQAKPADVELADTTASDQETGHRNVTDTIQTNGETQQSQAEQPNQRRQSAEGGIAAAVNADRSASVVTKPNSLGCSICTEDFEAGQDQRVLPCDHRFHPSCIDPWLLNVSGTCPLCRIDLRPQTSSTETGEVDENGNPILQEGETEPPPLGPNETAGDRQRMSIRRSIVIGLMGVGQPNRMTREERVFALRELRGQQSVIQRRQQLAGAAETAEEETSRRARLRNIFGIRTRRTGQGEGRAQPNSQRPDPDPRHTSTFGGSI